MTSRVKFIISFPEFCVFHILSYSFYMIIVYDLQGVNWKWRYSLKMELSFLERVGILLMRYQRNTENLWIRNIRFSASKLCILLILLYTKLTPPGTYFRYGRRISSKIRLSGKGSTWYGFYIGIHQMLGIKPPEGFEPSGEAQHLFPRTP